MFNHAAYIAPAGAAADEIIFFIIFQGVGGDMLVHNQRIAGAGLHSRYVGDTRQRGKHRARRGRRRRKEMSKQNGFVGQALYKRRRVQIRIGERSFIPGQRLHENYHHVVIFRIRRAGHPAQKVQRFGVRLVHLQVFGNFRIVLTHQFFVIIFAARKTVCIKQVQRGV